MFSSSPLPRVYQTFEAEPRESAKPCRLASFQVAFAPGAPGAGPAASAGEAGASAVTAAAVAAAVATAASKAVLRSRRRLMSPVCPAIGSDLRRLIMTSSSCATGLNGCSRAPSVGQRRDNDFLANIGLTETVGQNLTQK